MQENEGQEVESESGAEEASPEPAQTEGQEQASAAPAKEANPDSAPFHEHPRFKELVEQKNQALSQQKALEERLAQFESRWQQQQAQAPKAEASKDELIEHLRTIDPRLADRLEKFTNALPKFETMQTELQNFKQEQFKTTAINTINGLHESNKVAPEMRQWINNQLDLQYMQGTLKDIPSAYKSIHEGYSKFIEGVKRSTLEGYVPAKKADSNTPATLTKGKPASQSGKKASEFSKDPEVARQQVVSRYLKQVKAEADL